MLWMAVLEHSELPVEERHLAVIVLSLIVGLRFLWQIIYFFGLGSYAFWRKRTLLHNSPPELAHV
jgi:hypothetical protein